MLDSSSDQQVCSDSHEFDWAKKYAEALRSVRHMVYQMQLLSQRQLRFRGLDVYLNSPDRVILEDRILLYFAASARISRVLFVGCDWYTKPYKQIFRRQEYWTIEPDINHAKYGAKNHIVDGLENLSSHCRENYFDLIVCNGVFGYGLDTVAAANQALDSCCHCLNTNGVLLIGWNNVPQSSPWLLSSCEAIEQFTPYVFPAMSTSQCVTDTPNCHTFNFYTKSAKRAVAAKK